MLARLDRLARSLSWLALTFAIIRGIGALQAGDTALGLDPQADGILGVRPSYGPTALSEVPNPQAIGRRIWVPELDVGYDPQGLAVVKGDLLVSGYISEATGVHRGLCRIFRLDIASGRETGRFEVPEPCGHAGGIAYAGDGVLYVADTHTLFETTLPQAFGPSGVRLRAIPLAQELRGGLAASGQGDIWIGTYDENGPGRLSRFSVTTLRKLKDGEPLTQAMASAVVTIPSYAQGAAVDSSGKLWVTSSDYRWGRLTVIDPKSGTEVARYEAAPGIEGISFDGSGNMWAVAEAGARHFYPPLLSMFIPFYPVIFSINVQRLK